MCIYSVLFRCAYSVHVMDLQYTYDVLAMYLQCIYSVLVLTVYLLCLHNQNHRESQGLLNLDHTTGSRSSGGEHTATHNPPHYTDTREGYSWAARWAARWQ